MGGGYLDDGVARVVRAAAVIPELHRPPDICLIVHVSDHHLPIINEVSNNPVSKYVAEHNSGEGGHLFFNRRD